MSGTATKRPALIGGRPAFPDSLPITRPPLPALEDVIRRLEPSYRRGMVTNGALVRELEEAVAARLGTRNVVAVSSCTTGLMLVLRAFGVRGPVVLPSFTFSATAHAAAWNRLEPVFVDCDADTLQVDPNSAEEALDGAVAIVATHVFGAPCPVERLEALADRHHLPLVFDAAHALGARRRGRPVGGFGRAEVFSLTPTKPLIAGEGGLVATDDDGLAEEVRLGRNYGDPGDYDTRFVGLNGRMSELHAAVACAGLPEFDELLARRRAIARRYQDGLSGVPGLRFPAVDVEDSPTFKDMTVLVDRDRFGVDRDVLAAALKAEGIDTRRYFHPPVHRQTAYRTERCHELPVTDRVSAEVLSLPIFPGLDDAAVDAVVEAVAAAHGFADELVAAGQDPIVPVPST